ncbi:hypothetical protein EYZ11_011243 [Aspergillus tanneri]|uniref:Uncharacterized protein n=1 Tax=Aspergillus tanneri TaxID=1220188 RepID=A0A4S3J3B6_9EURO|nr:hypothetical protein EYZ11_011243 [Aspergillus tanneri]
MSEDVKSIGEIIAAQGLLNNLLKDDIMDEGYILNISIYVGNGLEQNKLPFGQHKRVSLYQGTPDCGSIISLEASGDQIERLPNIRDEQGRTLVMGKVLDFLRCPCVELTMLAKSLRRMNFETTYGRRYEDTSIGV